LYDFTGGNDGADVIGSLVLDSNANIFGITDVGGDYQQGVTFEITP